MPLQVGRFHEKGGADVPVTDGGTNASDASNARTNLGISLYDITSHDALITQTIKVADEGGVSLGDFSLLRFIGGGVTATDGGSGEADITIPTALNVDTDLMTFSGSSSAQTTGTYTFTPKVAIFFSALRNDSEGAGSEDETHSTGFATGTGTSSSPLQQAVIASIGGFHSSGTADRDRAARDTGYVAAALASENTSGTHPLNNVLDVTVGGAAALRVTQFSSAGIQLTPLFAGTATTLTGTVYILVLG